MARYALLAALAVLPLVVLCQDDIETICPQDLVKDRRDQLAVFDGVCFRFSSTHDTYAGAQRACRNDKGVRAMPKTKEIDLFLIGYMEQNGWDQAWIGLNDLRWEGDFEWSDMYPLQEGDYNNFGSQEGTRRTGLFRAINREHCVAIHADDKKWHDHICERLDIGKVFAGEYEKKFICQY